MTASQPRLSTWGSPRDSPSPDHLDHLRVDSALVRSVLTDRDPASRVPACPDWDASDLPWHLSPVQCFWAGVVSGRPAAPSGRHPDRPSSYAELLTTYDVHSARLLDALTEADPAGPAWTWADEQTVG